MQDGLSCVCQGKHMKEMHMRTHGIQHWCLPQKDTTFGYLSWDTVVSDQNSSNLTGKASSHNSGSQHCGLHCFILSQ